MRYHWVILMLHLLSCGGKESSTQVVDPLRCEYRVRLVYCDKAQGDTVITVATFDGHPPSSEDISSLNEPVPVYRVKGGAVFNVCDLQVIGKRTQAKAIHDPQMILNVQDSTHATP